MAFALDGALPFAADDLVRLAATPVDEVLDVLEVELDRQRQVLHLGLERLGPDAIDERVERLAVLAVALVHADPALDGVRHALGRQAYLQARAVGHVAVLVAAADVRHVGRQRAAAHLHRRAVEPDAAEVVLRAAVRAAAHLDVDPLGERVGDVHGRHAPLDGPVQAHRAGDAELAAVGARAADHVRDLVGARVAQVQLLEPGPDVVQRLVADPAQHEVLLDAGAGVAAGEVAHELRDAAELLGRQVAADDPDLGGREAGLTLRRDVRLDPVVELAVVAIRRARRGRRGRRVGLLVVEEEQRVGREVAVVDPVEGQLLLDLLAERVDPDLVDHELQPRALAVGAQPVLTVEDAQNGLRDLQVVAVVDLDEVEQRGADARHDRGAAAGADLDALDLLAVDLAHTRDESEVVDQRDRAVLVGRGERDLELARQQLADLVAHEVADEGAGVGGHVVGLAVADAGPRVARHVADGVAAGLAAREAGVGDHPDDLGRPLERDVVELEVLAGGDVALAQRRVVLGHVGERLHLLGRDAAEGELHADHLDVGLALAVDALLEPEADELLLGLLAGQEAVGAGVEVVELALEDGDHVPRDVLVDLRVVERAGLAAALRLFRGLNGSGLHVLSWRERERVGTRNWKLPNLPKGSRLLGLFALGARFRRAEGRSAGRPRRPLARAADPAPSRPRGRLRCCGRRSRRRAAPAPPRRSDRRCGSRRRAAGPGRNRGRGPSAGRTGSARRPGCGRRRAPRGGARPPPWRRHPGPARRRARATARSLCRCPPQPGA